MKEIQAKNLYGKGHEQRNERPYAIVYESKNYCLAFPKTTKDKRSEGIRLTKTLNSQMKMK